MAVLGIPFDNLTLDDTLDRIQEYIDAGGFHQIATANADFLSIVRDDAEMFRILCHCDLVVSDGMPIVWASHVLGAPLRERVTGADLLPRIAELAHLRGYRIFLLGATPESSRRAAEAIARQYPHAQIVGRLSPPISSIEEMDNEAILAEIERARPDVLLVAFGCPKQDKWIHRHRHRLNVPVCIGIGAAIDFMAGTFPRAPRWMQRSGLEWVFRLKTEPGRLYRRYAVDAVRLLQGFFSELVVKLSAVRTRMSGGITVYRSGELTVVRIAGALEGDLLAELERVVETSAGSASELLIDMTNAETVGAAGRATLLRLRQVAERHKIRVQLAGLRPGLDLSFPAALTGDGFEVVPDLASAFFNSSLFFRTEAGLASGVAAGEGATR